MRNGFWIVYTWLLDVKRTAQKQLGRLNDLKVILNCFMKSSWKYRRIRVTSMNTGRPAQVVWWNKANYDIFTDRNKNLLLFFSDTSKMCSILNRECVKINLDEPKLKESVLWNRCTVDEEILPCFCIFYLLTETGISSLDVLPIRL